MSSIADPAVVTCVEQIRSSTKGFGTDEQSLINALV
jgi:hypothetical protein